MYKGNYFLVLVVYGNVKLYTKQREWRQNNFFSDVDLVNGMGPTPRRELKCNICKSTFPSFKDKSNAKLSHRSHRNTNKICLAAQERLRRQHK
jgi:hypothetical protein